MEKLLKEKEKLEKDKKELKRLLKLTNGCIKSNQECIELLTGVERLERLWKQHSELLTGWEFKQDIVDGTYHERPYSLKISYRDRDVDSTDELRIEMYTRETCHIDDYDVSTKTDIFINDRNVYSEDN